MLKKLKKVFSTKDMQSLILLLAAIIPGLLVLISVVGLLSSTVFRFLVPVVLFIEIVLTITLLVLIDRFIKAIRVIDKNAIVMAQGDLNISDIISEKTRGLEILTSAINDMKRNLLSYIESTKMNVIVLSDAVDKVSKSIDMNYKGNEQIASNMSIVAEKAQDQLKIAKSTLEGIEKVSDGATRITSTLSNIEDFVENTVKLTSDSAGRLDQYSEQMQVITTNLEETANFIQTLSSNLTEINEFGKLIMTITGQLNLLSLNSRVEAARAGEAGRGFSVVAQEMNKLSDATKESVTQINNLLGNILKSNEKVSDSIANVTTSFTMSKEIFNNMKTSFDTINNNANILNSDIKKVYEESLMISDNTKDISEKGTELHDSSNEISSITQDVAAVTQEELAENEEINTQALSLNKMLSSIENLLKRYRTSILPVSDPSPKQLKFVMMSLQNNPFWESLKQGVLYAQTELKDKNVDVEFIGFDEINHTFIDTLNEKIEAGCDGLILPGSAVEGIEECVERANQKNIPVMSFNSDFASGTKRLSYFGPNIREEGSLAAEILARSINAEGDVIIFKGDTNSTIHNVRRDAAIAKLAKFKDIKIVSEIEDTTNNLQVYKKLKEMLYYLPNVKGILFIGSGASGAAKAIREMDLVGKVKLFSFDFVDEIVDLIKEGIVYKAFRQDPFGQGHDPIIYMYNYLVANQVPEANTYTRTEVVDQYSISD